MSGRVVFRKDNLDRMIVSDLTGQHNDMSDLLSSFWAQHAHQNIVIEWSCVTTSDGYTRYSANTAAKAREIKASREDLDYLCSPVRWDARRGQYTFIEYPADDAEI